MRLGRMAVDLFAMEALAYSVWHMADQHTYDVRIEAAITKIFCSERTIQFLKDAQIIFGGMGYETADSKRVRGEPAFGIEQLVRDAEMYRIGEGATDVMRPFVAREGLSPHLERTQRYLKGPSRRARLIELFKLVRFYAPWYIGLWWRRRLPEKAEFRHPKVAQLLGYVEYSSRRLASAIFWAMVRHGEQLRDDQGRQTRMELIGEHLLTIATVALEAASPASAKSGEQVWELVDHVVAGAKVQVDRAIAELRGRNQDHMIASIGRESVEGTYGWLSQGIIPRSLRDYLQPASERHRDFPK
jgi:acyl-CoA dehydrogenase-like protein